MTRIGGGRPDDDLLASVQINHDVFTWRGQVIGRPGPIPAPRTLAVARIAGAAVVAVLLFAAALAACGVTA